MNKSYSKDHHYLPKGVLRNFCFRGQTVYFADRDRSEKGIQERNIDTIFYKRHANSFTTKVGNRDDTAEKILDRDIDDKIAKVVRGLVSKQGQVIAGLEKEILAKYLVSRMMRLPIIRDTFARELDLESAIPAALENTGMTWEDIQDLWPEPSVPASFPDYLYAKLAAVQDLETTNKLIDSTLVTASPKGLGRFVIGDVPMVGRADVSGGSIPEHFEVWMVVAPTLMIGFVRRPDVDRSVQIDFSFSDDAMRCANIDIASASSKLASADREYLDHSIRESDFFKSTLV